jgi:hypothetical protein
MACLVDTSILARLANIADRPRQDKRLKNLVNEKPAATE